MVVVVVVVVSLGPTGSPVDKMKLALPTQMFMDGSKDFRSVRPYREKMKDMMKDSKKRPQAQDLKEYIDALDKLQVLTGGYTSIKDMKIEEICNDLDCVHSHGPLVWKPDPALAFLQRWQRHHCEAKQWAQFVKMLRPWENADVWGH